MNVNITKASAYTTRITNPESKRVVRKAKGWLHHYIQCTDPATGKVYYIFLAKEKA